MSALIAAAVVGAVGTAVAGYQAYEQNRIGREQKRQADRAEKEQRNLLEWQKKRKGILDTNASLTASRLRSNEGRGRTSNGMSNSTNNIMGVLGGFVPPNTDSDVNTPLGL